MFAKSRGSLKIYVRQVSRFIEKPKDTFARQLILKGGLWNTMIMVFNAKRLLDLVRTVSPPLFGLFNLIWQAIGTEGANDVTEQAYRNMQPVNFSRGPLEALSLHRPSPLWVAGPRRLLERLGVRRTASRVIYNDLGTWHNSIERQKLRVRGEV
jgi:hypothetical protein